MSQDSMMKLKVRGRNHWPSEPSVWRREFY
jgi:hypothetical protein